ncbi:MAG: tetratricopeptide repeat protein [Planctomycetes bacterium]|nr:tetratricopeptide repeat protein [Planctomycetota bacterium]
MTTLRRAWAPTLLIVVLSVGAYGPSLGGGFVYDDHRFVAHNAAIRSLQNVPAFFSDPSTVDPEGNWKGIYRPLRTLSYAVDHLFFAADPVGYRIHALLLHAAASLAAAVLLGRLLRRPRLGLALGALYAVHPVHVESVAWITSRADVLAGLLGLLHLLAMQRRGAGRTVLGCAWLALALFAKETSVVLPAIGLLLDRMRPARPARPFRRDLARWLPAALLAAAYLGVRHAVLGEHGGQRPFWGDSFWITAASMVTGSGWYVLRLVVPEGFRFDWQLPLVALADLQVWALAAGWALGLGAITWQMARGRLRRAGAGGWWFVIALAPVSNVVIPINILVAERFLYLPAVGFLLVVGAAMAWAVARPKPWGQLAVLAGAVWFVFLAATARDFARHWSTEKALWDAVIRHSPAHYRGYQGKAKALVQAQDLEGARAALLLAIARGGWEHASVYFDMARTYLLEDRHPEAIPYLRQAVERWRAGGETAKNRAYALTLEQLRDYFHQVGDAAEAHRMAAWRREASGEPP